MGWLPTVLLVVVGIVPLVVVASRVFGALRRTRFASETLNTSITGRTRRIQAGVEEAREWRAAHRTVPAGEAEEPRPTSAVTEEASADVAAGRLPAG